MKWILAGVTLSLMVFAGLVAPERPQVRAGAMTATTEAAPAPLSTFRSARRAFQDAVDDAARPVRYRSDISQREAVEIALRRGEEFKAARLSGSAADRQPAPGPDTADTQVAAADAAPSDAWRVTADRVNLRDGPGTDHPVVGGAKAGDLLVPVSDLGSAWVKVRRPSGDTAWIFSRFISRADG